MISSYDKSQLKETDMGEEKSRARLGRYLHDNGDEDGGPEPLEQDIGDRLKDGIRDEKNG